MHEGQGGLGEAGFCPEMHGGGRRGGEGGRWMWVAAKFDCPKRQAVPRRHRTPISISEFHSTFHGQDFLLSFKLIQGFLDPCGSYLKGGLSERVKTASNFLSPKWKRER